MTRFIVLAVLLGSSVCAQAHRSAAAEPRASVVEVTQRALAAYEHREYSAAVRLFRRALASDNTALAELYLARSQAALGHLVEAADAYRGALDGPESARVGTTFVGLAEAARDELAQLRPRIPLVDFALGEAELRSRKLQLRVDGRLVPLGALTGIDPGKHEVIASDADGERTRVTFEVNEGERKSLALNWRTVVPSAKDQPLSLGSSSTRRTLGVVALSVGATGLGVGTVTGVAALTKYSPAEQHCPAGKCSEGPVMPENSSAFLALRTISSAGFVVGGVGIGTWLGLLLSTPTASSTERPTVSRWTPVVGMGSAGARYTF